MTLFSDSVGGALSTGENLFLSFEVDGIRLLIT